MQHLAKRASRLLPSLRAAPSSCLTLAPRYTSFQLHFSTSSPAMGPLETSIQQKLTSALSPTHLAIQNDSSKHAGHAAMRAQGGGNGETHFSVLVVSEVFDGVRMIQRHRKVNDALKEEFDAGLHALSIKAKTPKEFEAEGEGQL